MKLGTIRRILKENLGSGIPSWVEGLLSPLNQFIEAVSLALSGRLTFQDNFACTITSQSMTDATWKNVNPGSSQKVQGVFVIDSGGEPKTSFTWRANSDGTVGLYVTFATAGAEKIVKFIILF